MKKKKLFQIYRWSSKSIADHDPESTPRLNLFKLFNNILTDGIIFNNFRNKSSKFQVRGWDLVDSWGQFYSIKVFKWKFTIVILCIIVGILIANFKQFTIAISDRITNFDQNFISGSYVKILDNESELSSSTYPLTRTSTRSTMRPINSTIPSECYVDLGI